MTKRFIRNLGATMLVTALALTSVDAQQDRPTAGEVERPLPAFTAQSASGAIVTSDQLNEAERWLLVYVVPGTVVCDRLLHALDEWAVSDGSRIVVIAAGSAAVIDASIRPLLRNASSAAVYADPDGSAARALGLTSRPALVGIANRTINWIVQGVLNDPRMVEPVVRNWLRVS